VLYELNTNGTVGSSISSTAYAVSAPFSGTLDGPVGELITLGSDVRGGGTSTWVVGCFASIGGTGAEQRGQTINVTLSTNGSSYSAG
jgi:hypothetical protein